MVGRPSHGQAHPAKFAGRGFGAAPNLVFVFWGFPAHTKKKTQHTNTINKTQNKKKHQKHINTTMPRARSDGWGVALRAWRIRMPSSGPLRLMTVTQPAGALG